MAWELALIAAIIGVCFIFVFVAGMLQHKDYAPLRFLLLGVTLFVLVIAVNLGTPIIEANNSTLQATTIDKLNDQIEATYTTVLWVAITVSGYLIIWFLYKMMKWLVDIKNAK